MPFTVITFKLPFDAWDAIQTTVSMLSKSAVGYPHGFNIYWGYISLFNLLDYPSVILPILKFKVDRQLDPVDDKYQPMETNPYHKPNYELCNSSTPVQSPKPMPVPNSLSLTDDPDLFANQPSTIQMVGRPFEDEEAIRVAYILDELFRAP